MVSKRKIGICLAVISVLTLLITLTIGNSYEGNDFFWGYFAVILTVIFLSMAIGIYMLSVHFKETKPKLSQFLWGFGIYILVATVGGIVYSILNIYGVISFSGVSSI